MSKFKFYGVKQDYHPYKDYEFSTNNPNEYWVLTHNRENDSYSAVKCVAEDDEALFDVERQATPTEIKQLLDLIPQEKLISK